MRVLLIQPRLSGKVRSLGRLEPLPLEILAAALPEHEVRILDYRFEKDPAGEVAAWRPEVVGVTALTVEYADALDAIREIKALVPDARIVVGGTHATLVPQDFNIPEVSAVVIGLGHDAFRELLETYAGNGDASNVAGLAFPDGNGMRFNAEREAEKSFDSIPNPDRSLTARYRRSYRATFSLDPEGDGVSITSLGCPGRCSFCSSWKQNKGRYLERDAGAVVEDILSIPSRRVMLADDNSLHNIERAREIVRLLGRSDIRKHIRTYVRADTIVANPDLMKALREVGFRALIVGYEAVTDKRLEDYRKGNTVETNRAAIRVLREAGIENRAMFVVAQDFEKEDFEELFEFVDSEGLRTPLFTVLTPVPGTGFYRKVEKDLLTRNYLYFEYAHSVLPTRMDYMEFYEEYARLFKRSYSFSRYFRDWWREQLEFLRTGRRPATERRYISFVEAIFLQWIFRRFVKPLREDYRHIAQDAGRPVSSAAASPSTDTAAREGGSLCASC